MSVCGAKTRAGGKCKRQAGWGTSHLHAGRCAYHGGASPEAEVSGLVELARREAVVMGEPLPIEAHAALLKCIAIANAEVEYATREIARLTPEEAVGPVITTHDRPLKYEKGAESTTERATETREGEPRLHIWIKARHEAMDRLVAYSAAAIKANVDERAVQLAEGMAHKLAAAMKAFAVAVGVDPADPSVRAALRASLLTLDGTSTEVPTRPVSPFIAGTVK